MSSSSTLSPTHRLATVISYCSYEKAYIDVLIDNARVFSDAVVVSVGERLYTGAPEDEREVARLRAKYEGDAEVRVVRYGVGLDELERPIPLHNRARVVGVQTARTLLGEDIWVLLLDGDEVPDGPAVRAWWRAAQGGNWLVPHVAFKMLNHWVFLHPRLVADVHEDSVVLVHASRLTPAALDHPRERDGILMESALPSAVPRPLQVARRVPGLDGKKPMFWHYSWVRATRAELHAKVQSWGHKSDRADWPALVDAAYDAMEREEWPERDFVHGYTLRLCPVGEGPIDGRTGGRTGPPAADGLHPGAA
jgi:hypothetical protein